MSNENEIGKSRLDSLYVIADTKFDSVEYALTELESFFCLKRSEDLINKKDSTKENLERIKTINSSI